MLIEIRGFPSIPLNIAYILAIYFPASDTDIRYQNNSYKLRILI